MGATLKYILVALILYYLWNNHLKKILQVFFKGSSNSNTNQRTNYQSYKGKSYMQQEPTVKSRPSKSASMKDFKGGEYVDFEEID